MCLFYVWWEMGGIAPFLWRDILYVGDRRWDFPNVKAWLRSTTGHAIIQLEKLEFVGEDSYERKNKMQRRIGDNKRA